MYRIEKVSSEKIRPLRHKALRQGKPYSTTGYLSGNLKGLYSKINPFFFNFLWVSIFLLQFFIFCIVNYQEILIIDLNLFLGKWLGTSIYTISFMVIIQFIYPLNRIE